MVEHSKPAFSSIEAAAAALLSLLSARIKCLPTDTLRAMAMPMLPAPTNTTTCFISFEVYLDWAKLLTTAHFDVTKNADIFVKIAESLHDTSA